MPEIVKTKRSKGKKAKRSLSPSVSYSLSALKGLLLTFIMLGGISFLVMNNGSFSPFYKVFSYIAVGLGAFVCGFCAYRAVKSRGIVNGAIAAAIYCGVLVLILVCLMRLRVSPQILLLVPISLGSGIAGGIAGANL